MTIQLHLAEIYHVVGQITNFTWLFIWQTRLLTKTFWTFTYSQEYMVNGSKFLFFICLFESCHSLKLQAINRLPPLLQCLAEANNPTVHSSIAEPIAELNDDLSKFQQMIETTVDMEAVDKG